jgi:hypothetical protein
MAKTTTPKVKKVCPKCGKCDPYETIAGQCCWDCDVLLVEATASSEVTE